VIAGSISICQRFDRFFDVYFYVVLTFGKQYHDRHTMSRLIGSPPGYVGFEEGGQSKSTFCRMSKLTQRSRRPTDRGSAKTTIWYVTLSRFIPFFDTGRAAVILLDELEKAHKVILSVLGQETFY
jgi:hypothetical protein